MLQLRAATMANGLKVIIVLWWCLPTTKAVNIGRLRYTWRVTLLDRYSYGKYFQTEPDIQQPTQRTLKVDTEIYGIDFITFFATDPHR